MNKNGYTLFEVIISIAVASIVLLMLTQMLTMNISITNKIEKEKILFDQTTTISDTIKNNIFELEVHSVREFDDNDDNTIVIHFVHEFDIMIDPDTGVLGPNFDNPVTDVLIYNIEEETLRYNGDLLHNSSAKVLLGSTIELIRVDDEFCAVNPDDQICQEGVVKLTLILTYELANGNRINQKEYVTTIIV